MINEIQSKAISGKSAHLSVRRALEGLKVDVTGKTIVFYGTHEECLNISNKISSYGPDHRLTHSLSSMNAEVQS